MIKVTLEFKDGDIVIVKIATHVFDMWNNEMKRDLDKVAKIITFEEIL
jgi:hypothetical protein